MANEQRVRPRKRKKVCAFCVDHSGCRCQETLLPCSFRLHGYGNRKIRPVAVLKYLPLPEHRRIADRSIPFLSVRDAPGFPSPGQQLWAADMAPSYITSDSLCRPGTKNDSNLYCTVISLFNMPRSGFLRGISSYADISPQEGYNPKGSFCICKISATDFVHLSESTAISERNVYLFPSFC